MQKIIIIFLLSLIASQAFAENPEVLRCSAAAHAFKEKRYEEAYTLCDKSCPKLRDLSRWKQLRFVQGALTLADYTTFMESHKGWPWLGELRKEGERFITSTTPPSQIISWFQAHNPRSFRALKIYLTALHPTKNTALYKEVLHDAWRNLSLTAEEEDNLLSQTLLTQDEHLQRFKTFLAQGNAKIAGRQIGRCDPSMRPYLKARLALREGHQDASRLYEKLNTAEKGSLDIIEDYFTYLQKKESSEVYSFIRKHKADFAKAPQRFWRLRYIAARDALVTKDYAKVFEVLGDHGLTKGDGYIQSQFLLGFVAFRFLNDPERALKYLEPAYPMLTSAGAITRFAFWIGMAHEKKGNAEQVKIWFEKAMAHPQSFYGQEAFIKMERPLKLSYYRLHYTPQERATVLSNHHMPFLNLLKDLESFEDIPPFLYKVHDALKGSGEKRAFLTICTELFPFYVYDMARLMGMVYVYEETYPMHPDASRAKDPAMINAIIRKESGFNPYAVSQAGAKGLMQLMPKTAQIIGKDIQVRVDPEELTKDPTLNVKLGTAYFEQKLRRFQGHQALTLAGYNAGPLNADKWVTRYGDPRTNEVDLLTWIELLPFHETRSYVRRVIANQRVYKILLKKQGQ